MSKLNWFGSLALSAHVLVFAGCGGGTDVELVPVAGTVSIAGEPAEGVTVTLLGESIGEKRLIPSGRTDAEGKFDLRVSEMQSGSPVGEYTVLFQKLTLPDGSPIQEDQMAADVGAVNQINSIYSDPATSPESVTIPAGGNESLNFDLQPKR